MITSFIWAQIASRDGSVPQIPVDGGRYVRSGDAGKTSLSQGLVHAFWFLMISAGVAFFLLSFQRFTLNWVWWNLYGPTGLTRLARCLKGV